MGGLTQDIAKFVAEIKFEDLSKATIREAKRTILDSIGCALAGITSDKGKIAIELSRRLGGPPESTIIGVGEKVSCNSAAFANGELINALDYDSLLPPIGHVSPCVIPASLAIAESSKASGKDLILGTVIGHEIAARIALVLPPIVEFAEKGPEEGNIRWSQTYGLGNIFGGVASTGKILKLDYQKMSHLLGLAGHFRPVSMFSKWIETIPSAMTKYASAGWISSAVVISTLLAEMGYIGDITVLDSDGLEERCASQNWGPNTIMDKIGEKWLFLNMEYKPYPCCRGLHGGLDAFISLIDQYDLKAEDIESIRAFCHPLANKPLWQTRELTNHVDAQFSFPYCFAVAAHRVRIGADWQDSATMGDPKIIEFMNKVSCQVHPKFEKYYKDPRSRVGMVEVVAKGKTFREERKYYKGTPFTDFQITDEELVEKFRNNASRILTRGKIDKVGKFLFELENMENIAELMKQISL